MESNELFFVKNGSMCSGSVIVELNISIQTKDPTYFEGRWLSPLFGNMTLERIQHLKALSERPGTWYVMTGQFVVHSEDCWPTQEEAAKAEYERLKGE